MILRGDTASNDTKQHSRYRSIRRILAATALLSILALMAWYLDSLRPVVYYNADIVTLNAAQPRAEALLSEQGQLTAVGSNKAILDQASWLARRINLQGKQVLPGFIDAHSHFLVNAMYGLAVNLEPPPRGTIDSLENLYRVLAQHAEKTPKDQWIIGFNYDDTQIAGKHPERAELDKLAPENPVLLRHVSGHLAVANSLALVRLGHTKDTIQTQSGLLTEHDVPTLQSLLPKHRPVKLWQSFQNAVARYAQAGYTTIQSGGTSEAQFTLLGNLSRFGLLPLRVVAWPSQEKYAAESLANAQELGRFDSQYFQQGAIKIVLDGSPQGRTALLSQPYHDSGQYEPGWKGEQLYDAATLRNILAQWLQQRQPVALHANGDGAIDVLLESLQGLEPLLYEDHRSLLVHAQTIRADQIAKVIEAGFNISFFPAHTYYWGDWHRKVTLGPERAAFISPAQAAINLGARISIHTDAPVTAVSALQLMWHAMERQTMEGVVLGPEQRLDRRQALAAITSDAAWQLQLEHSRGTLEVGKFCDFVVLDGDFFSIEDIRKLEIINTVVGGKVVYKP